MPSLALWKGLLLAASILSPVTGAPTEDAQTFDYIVVGGGVGGSTIATRLAQKSFKVALIEAGGWYEVEQPLAQAPAADILGVGSDPNIVTPIDWGFVTEGSPGTGNRQIHYARGKCLGGSSALNAMIYQRPTIETMGKWAHEVNDSSYEWEQTLPYFEKSITFTPPDNGARPPNVTTEYNADVFQKEPNEKTSPIHVSYSNFVQPWATWVKLGLQAIGIAEREDFNSGGLIGNQYNPSTIRHSDDTRSSADKFLTAESLPSLTIFTHTLAKKVVFQDGQATGVDVEGKGLLSALLVQKTTLSAKREVIVSAGAFQSPQLLMVSGIGPSDTLAQHDIHQLVELPGVGQNMMDHAFITPTYQVQTPSFISRLENLQLINVLTNGSLTSSAADFLDWEKLPAHLRHDLSKDILAPLDFFPPDWPELEYLSIPAYFGNVSAPTFSQPLDGAGYGSILGTLVAPTARGNVTIRSADTADLPVINPNLFGSATDMKLAVGMVKRIREAFASEAMQPVLVGKEYYPGEEVQSDAQIEEFVRQNAMTIWHASATCKMGTARDAMAVVDHRARVFGVQGLRVVDASAFPFLPPGHPQSSIYMLAEKIADDIVKSSAY